MRKRSLIVAFAAVVATAVAVLALAWGQSASDQPTAQAAGTGVMDLIVKAGAKICIAPSDPTPPAPPAKPNHFCVAAGGAFKLSVQVTQPPAGGYLGIQTWVDYGPNLTYTKKSIATEIVWPDAFGINLRAQTGTAVNHGDRTGLSPQPKSNFVGNIVELNMTCPAGDSVNTVTLIPWGDSVAGTSGAAFLDMTGKQIPASDSIEIHCQPGPTPTFTPTPTPTATPTGPPVGGVAAAPEVAQRPQETPGSSDGSAIAIATLVAAATAGAIVLGGAAWYARGRRARR